MTKFILDTGNIIKYFLQLRFFLYILKTVFVTISFIFNKIKKKGLMNKVDSSFTITKVWTLKKII